MGAKWKIVAVSRPDFKGVWRADREWPSGDGRIVEVLDDVEMAPRIQVPEDPKRDMSDPYRLGTKEFAAVMLDGRLTKVRADVDVPADFSAALKTATGRIASLEASLKAAKEKIENLSANLSSATARAEAAEAELDSAHESFLEGLKAANERADAAETKAKDVGPAAAAVPPGPEKTEDAPPAAETKPAKKKGQ